MRLRFFLTIVGCCLLVAVLAPPAFAQEDCANVCGGNVECGRDCSYCDIVPDIGLECPGWAFHSVTCGDWTNWCIEDGCNSDWVEVSREVQGTYGSGYYFYCEHHRVEWVTEYDYNHCVRNPDGWYHYYCHDEMDGWKAGSGADCCDGTPPGYGFECNGYHQCTG